MPTAAKLIAALAFVAISFAASRAIVAALPEGTVIGRFVEVNMIIGALAGWFVLGRLAGAGYARALGAGLRSAVVLAFYALIAHALAGMLERALQRRYSDVMEALAGAVELVGRYALMLLKTPIALAILILGGMLAALLVEWASQRWK